MAIALLLELLEQLALMVQRVLLDRLDRVAAMAIALLLVLPEQLAQRV
jgi:hypothetical protein